MKVHLKDKSNLENQKKSIKIVQKKKNEESEKLISNRTKPNLHSNLKENIQNSAQISQLKSFQLLANESHRSKKADIFTNLVNSNFNPVQLISKKERRRRKKVRKGIAYTERLDQKNAEAMLGSTTLRQEMDLRNPTKPDVDRRSVTEKMSKIDRPDRKAWTKTLKANMHLLPEGYTPTLTEMPGAGYDGLTNFNDRKKEVQVRYDPDEVGYSNNHRRIGRLAATFTHELAIHGPNLRGDPDEEHTAMASPEGRQHYLAAAHRTFNELDNAKQKRAFANEWKSDIFNHLKRENLPRGEKVRRRQWATREHQIMLDAITSPTKNLH